MNPSSEQRSVHSNAPSFTPAKAMSDPKETAQEAIHQVMSKSAARQLIPNSNAVNPSTKADKGDNEMTNKPAQHIPSADEIKGIWKQHVGAAKIMWSKLTDDEFLKLEGHVQKLTGLIQERYAITRDEADKQVKSFFEKHQS